MVFLNEHHPFSEQHVPALKKDKFCSEERFFNNNKNIMFNKVQAEHYYYMRRNALCFSFYLFQDFYIDYYKDIVMKDCHKYKQEYLGMFPRKNRNLDDQYCLLHVYILATDSVRPRRLPQKRVICPPPFPPPPIIDTSVLFSQKREKQRQTFYFRRIKLHKELLFLQSRCSVARYMFFQLTINLKSITLFLPKKIPRE